MSARPITPLLCRAAAVLVVADAMERLIDGAALVRCTRDGRVLKLATSVVEPWPLQEPLRRLGQVYGLDVRLDLEVAARGLTGINRMRTFDRFCVNRT